MFYFQNSQAPETPFVTCEERRIRDFSRQIGDQTFIREYLFFYFYSRCWNNVKLTAFKKFINKYMC